MATRLSDKEASMFATGAMSVGLPLGANFFRSFFKVGKERAAKLEGFQKNLTKAEIAQIRSKIPDAK